MKEIKFGIQLKLLALIVFPLILLLGLLLVNSIVKSSASNRELYKEKLKAIAISINDSYNTLLSGDWNLNDDVLHKGINPVDVDLLERISEKDGIEITLFYGGVRYLTTIEDAYGNKLIGTKADSEIIEAVYKNGTEHISENVLINNVEYFAFYMPLTNPDGTIVGMFFIGQEKEVILRSIYEVNISLLTGGVIFCLVIMFLSCILLKPIASAISSLSMGLNKFADGDLSIICNIPKINKNDELGILAYSINNLVCKFKGIMEGIQQQAGILSEDSKQLMNIVAINKSSVERISHAIGDVAKGAEEQAQNMTDTTGNIQKLTRTLDIMAEGMDRLTEIATVLKNLSYNTKDVMSDLTEANDQVKISVKDIVIQTSSTIDAMKEINTILDSINNIASQTNLLSLNASIEAARAGEAGKGFAVVAGEVKKLADDCVNASRHIADIVKNITSQMSKSENLIKTLEDNSGKQLEKLHTANNSVDKILSGISEISSSTCTISTKLYDLDVVKIGISDAVENLSAIAEENAASSEETAENSNELNRTVNQLAEVATDIDLSVGVLYRSIILFKKDKDSGK